MVARARTVAFQGIEVVDVDVQVQMAAGMPVFTVVGLPDKAVGESGVAPHSAPWAWPCRRTGSPSTWRPPIF